MVSTPLKNISQNRNLPQIGVKIKNIRNHHLVVILGPPYTLRGMSFLGCLKFVVTNPATVHHQSRKIIGFSMRQAIERFSKQPGRGKTQVLNDTWQPLGPLLKVIFLVGYM